MSFTASRGRICGRIAFAGDDALDKVRVVDTLVVLVSYASARCKKCFSQPIASQLTCPRHDKSLLASYLRPQQSVNKSGSHSAMPHAALPNQGHQHPAGATSTDTQGKAWGSTDAS